MPSRRAPARWPLVYSHAARLPHALAPCGRALWPVSKSSGYALPEARDEPPTGANPTILVGSCRNRRKCAGTSSPQPGRGDDCAKSSGDALFATRGKPPTGANPTILVASCRNRRRCAACQLASLPTCTSSPRRSPSRALAPRTRAVAARLLARRTSPGALQLPPLRCRRLTDLVICSVIDS